jgi:hypothetical protein
MEKISNLCVSRKFVHIDHARRTWCAHVKDRGEWTTRVAIGKRFYLPKMKEDMEHFTRICVKCQNMKSIYKKKYGLYKLLLFLNEPWESVSMDFMTQLPKWNGCHSSGSQLIFQVGKNGSNKNNYNNFWFNKVIFWYVGEALWDASIHHKW